MSNWQSKKILVTGADGFIGSHLAETLVRKGADVTALVLYNSFDSHGWLDEAKADVASAIRMVRGDIRDAYQMTQLAQGQDIVFHLAALIAIPYSYHSPGTYLSTNIQGTLIIPEDAQKGLKDIIIIFPGPPGVNNVTFTGEDKFEIK